MGAFIVVEGIDGTGKTTVCRGASEILRSEGLEVDTTMEPTQGPIGALIRSDVSGSLSQEAQSLLFVADRIEHTAEIRRKTAEGAVVICDRYYPSTLAYQSCSLDGEAADGGWLMGLNERFVAEPDAVILLDMDPRGSMRRVESRGEEESRFEDLAYQVQVRERYLGLAERFGFEVVDASRPRDEVLADVIGIIREFV